MQGILENRIFWAALAAMVAAQVLKVVLILVLSRKFQPFRLMETGGMPSSHTSSVAALVTGIVMEHGWESPLFAIAMVFGTIVMYDAMGVRRAAGKHAEMINELYSQLSHLFESGEAQEKALKTLLGHTYPQVLVGLILGISVALIIV